MGKEGEKKAEGEEITDATMKHPLQNSWTLWYFEPNKTKENWEEQLNNITTFKTVEDFWSLYNHIKAPSELKNGCDYSLFKTGITPMWEDVANKSGGRWLITLDKRHKMSSNELDNYWMEILLLMVGEAFDEHSDDVCGATINIRPKMDKIGFWTGNYLNEDAVLTIGKRIKERLNVPHHQKLQYQKHIDSNVQRSSTIKITFTI